MAQKKIRVGIIGVHPERGWAMTSHIPALKSLADDFEITALSNSNAALAKAASEKFNIPRAFTTNQELINHPEVDLVIVTVKVPHHYELVSAAIKAGKNVFSEWPLGLNLKEASDLADLATQKKVHGAIGLQTRSAPAFNYVRDLIKNGHIGEVLSTTLIGSGISWGGEMEDALEYALDSSNGAGMFHVSFAHSLDGVLYALDTEFTEINSLLAERRKEIKLLPSGKLAPLRTPDQVIVKWQA